MSCRLNVHLKLGVRSAVAVNQWYHDTNASLCSPMNIIQTVYFYFIGSNCDDEVFGSIIAEPCMEQPLPKPFYFQKQSYLVKMFDYLDLSPCEKCYVMG